MDESFESHEINEGTVLYPTCDSEFGQDVLMQARLKQLVSKEDKPLLVSISTRARLSGKLLSNLADWNAALIERGRGFLKVSLSFSARDSLPLVEPRASTYRQRLQTLKSLVDARIPTSVNLKPILPGIPASEYEAIITETRTICDVFLLGGLYVDPHTPYGQGMLDTFASISNMRAVNWLSDRPVWPYLEDKKLINHLRKFIETIGGCVFEDDLSVMKHIAAREAFTLSP